MKHCPGRCAHYECRIKAGRWVESPLWLSLRIWGCLRCQLHADALWSPGRLDEHSLCTTVLNQPGARGSFACLSQDTSKWTSGEPPFIPGPVGWGLNLLTSQAVSASSLSLALPISMAPKSCPVFLKNLFSFLLKPSPIGEANPTGAFTPRIRVCNHF